MKKVNYSKMLGAAKMLGVGVLATLMVSCGSKKSSDEGNADGGSNADGVELVKGMMARGAVQMVPADAAVLMHIDAKRLIENAGLIVNADGSIKLAGELKKLTDDYGVTAMIAPALQLTKGIDLSDLYVVGLDNGRGKVHDVYCVATLTDAAAVMKNIEEAAEITGKDVNGMKVYDLDDVKLAIDGNVAWFVERVNKIDGFKAKAIESPLIGEPVLAGFVGADHVINLAVDMAPVSKAADLPAMFNAMTLCATVDVDGPTLSAELWLMDDEGERMAFDGYIKPIADEALSYVNPSRCYAVAAVGKPVGLAMQALNSQADRLGEYASFVTSISGTTVLSVDIEKLYDNATAAVLRGDYNYVERLDEMEILQMTNVEMLTDYGKNADNLFSQLNTEVMSSGLPVTKVDNNSFSVNTFGLTPNIYYGKSDNYVGLGTYELKSRVNALADKFSGNLAEVYLHIASSELTHKLNINNDIDALVAVTPNSIKAEVTLTGSQRLLETLLGMANSSMVRELINQQMGMY